MPVLSEIIGVLERFAPPVYQESYDNSGLLVGSPTKKIRQALVTLDCTEAVVDEAIEKRCQLIVAHHPILFKGLKSLTGKTYVERTLLKAIRHDIALYACHTNLDHVGKGVNKKMADRLGLEQIRILDTRPATLRQLFVYVPVGHLEMVRASLFSAGAGQLGTYSDCSFNTQGTGTFRPLKGSKPFVGKTNVLQQEAEARLEVVFPLHLEQAVLQAMCKSHPYEEIAYGLLDIQVPDPNIGAGLIGQLPVSLSEKQFLKLVCRKFKTSCIRHTALRGKPVNLVALCGGAGSFLLNKARKAGADAFITADFKYHEFFDAEGEILVADIGHYESERYTPEIFSELLLENFPTFAVLKSTLSTNPVNYFY